jgi:hypothetical protein
MSYVVAMLAYSMNNGYVLRIKCSGLDEPSQRSVCQVFPDADYLGVVLWSWDELSVLIVPAVEAAEPVHDRLLQHLPRGEEEATFGKRLMYATRLKGVVRNIHCEAR